MSIHRVTMTDVAKEAGVTQATVSHVMNGTAKISEEVTKRVRKAAEELNYVPRKGSTSSKQPSIPGVIGLIVPDVTNGFYSDIIKGVDNTMRQRGIMTFQCNTYYRPQNERAYIDILIESGIAGILVGYPLVNKDCYKILRGCRIPVVILDNYTEKTDSGFSTVRMNNLAGGRLAAEHLEKIGRKQVCIASEPESSLAIRQRIKGFCDYLENQGITVDSRHFYIEDSQYGKIEMGYNIGAKILLDGNIDAVFATTDQVAFGIIKRFKEHGIRVPEDIAVIGYDNVEIANILEPPLTTVAQPAVMMAEKGAEFLYNQITDPDAELESIVLDPGLVIRKSTINH